MDGSGSFLLHKNLFPTEDGKQKLEEEKLVGKKACSISFAILFVWLARSFVGSSVGLKMINMDKNEAKNIYSQATTTYGLFNLA